MRIRSYFLDFFLVLVIVLAFAALLLWVRLDITLTLVLLVGVWILDGYIKKTYCLGNETVFADLSFSALIFVGSQGVGLITISPPIPLDRTSFARLAIVTFVLGILWIGNLSVCRGLTETRARGSESAGARFWIWSASLVLAILSTCSALISQVVGLI
jgi:hypothetical protein